MEKNQSCEKMDNEKVKVMCWGNNYLAPCTSPFNLKLQTYMRMAGIDYEVVSCVMSSSKGKTPFIEFKGQTIDEPTNIINFLNRQFGKNLNENLSLEEVEKSFEIQAMIEKDLFYSMEYQRWFMDDEIISKFPLTNWFFRFIFKLMLKYKIQPELLQEMEIHSMDKYKPEELVELANKTLSIISAHLGDGLFFMGKEPSEIDSAMFGFLGILQNGMESLPSGQFATKNFPNLVAYVERMRGKYWHDWDQLCSAKKQQVKKSCGTKQNRDCCSNQTSSVNVA